MVNVKVTRRRVYFRESFIMQELNYNRFYKSLESLLQNDFISTLAHYSFLVNTGTHNSQKASQLKQELDRLSAPTFKIYNDLRGSQATTLKFINLDDYLSQDGACNLSYNAGFSYALQLLIYNKSLRPTTQQDATLITYENAYYQGALKILNDLRNIIL